MLTLLPYRDSYGPVNPRWRATRLRRWGIDAPTVERAGWGGAAVVADPGRRFDDLFDFVHDPATLIVAFDRVPGNHGARTPGIDGMTVTVVDERIGFRVSWTTYGPR